MPATKVSSSITSQIFKGSLISAKFGERCFRAEIPLDEEVKAETPTVVLCVPGEELSEGFVFRITETVPEVVTLEWLSGVLTTALGAYAKEQGWGKSAKWNIHWQSVAWCGGQERQHERSSRERQGIGAVVGSHFIGLGEADCYAVNLQRRGR